MSGNNLKEQLADIDRQVAEIDSQIEKLKQKKALLQTKKESLRNAALKKESDRLASKDWNTLTFPWSEKLQDKMKQVFEIETFRPYQLATINAMLSGHDCILIMPTGGGKSLCFQLPALISNGITLVVSPLVALMEDQIMALKSKGIPAEMWNASTSKGDADYINKAMVDKGTKLRLLYVTPEKLAKSKRFMAKLQKMYEIGNFSCLAVDEVHCCSQWGHDFRRDYNFLGIMKKTFPKVPILGLTATATSRVTQDVQKMLNIEGCLVFKASFNRPNLFYKVIPKPSAQKEAIETLADIIKSTYRNKSGIIYCFSIKESEEVAKDLRTKDVTACAYHAQLEPKQRSQVHKLWLSNQCQVVVATIAFGMGIDKPDVRFVIHYSISKSMENYYQESGRAGRDDKKADCILLYRFGDVFRQSTMVYSEQAGQEHLYQMVSYSTDVKSCRRAIIAGHFGERWESNDCNQMCDHCVRGDSVEINSVDVAGYCRSLILILNHASAQEQRMTAQKVVDAWVGKGPSNLRVASVKPPLLSRESCERVLAFFLLEGFLVEDFHFTPYSTISYINQGDRGDIVMKNKDYKIEMNVVRRSDKPKPKVTKGSDSTPSTPKVSTESGKNIKNSPSSSAVAKSSSKKPSSSDSYKSKKSTASPQSSNGGVAKDKESLAENDVQHKIKSSLKTSPTLSSNKTNTVTKPSGSNSEIKRKRPVVDLSSDDDSDFCNKTKIVKQKKSVPMLTLSDDDE